MRLAGWRLAACLVLVGCTARPAADGSVAVAARAVALDPTDPGRAEIGVLRFVGGLVLNSRDRRFGGLSGLRVRDDGRVLAVSDGGNWVAFRLVEEHGRPIAVADLHIAPILDASGNPPAAKVAGDAEAVEWNGSSVLVTFEQDHRLQHYHGIDPARSGSLAAPAVEVGRIGAAKSWPGNGGAEAFATFGEDSDLVLSEEPTRSDGTHDGLVTFDGQTLAFRYRPPAGFRPTDAHALPDGRLLILHRRFTPLAGAAAMIGWISVAHIRFGAVIAPRELARLAPPLTVDNMEGLGVRREGGRTFVYLVSDDNFSPAQRTLLLKFELRS